MPLFVDFWCYPFWLFNLFARLTFLCLLGVIQKLIERSKHILAVKYIFHFKLTDKMPPVPILKAYVDDAQKLGKRLVSGGKSLVCMHPLIDFLIDDATSYVIFI